MEVAEVMQSENVTMVKLMPTILKYLLSAEKTRTMKFPKLKWVTWRKSNQIDLRPQPV